MQILFFGNNWVGWQIIDWLKRKDEQVVGVVIHPPEKRKYGKEIINSAQVDPMHIFDGSQLRQPEILKAIKELHPDIGVSAFFGYIMHPEILELIPGGCVNIHPALLPYNRGANPNVWNIIEDTPAGATLHYIDSGVDTGDIIAQREIPVELIDTGESLYRKLENVCFDLFKEMWPLIRSGHAPRIPQVKRSGTYHRTRDLEHIGEINLDRRYTARELLNMIRARTFPPYPGVYFWHKGRKIYLRLQLLYEEQLRAINDGKYC